MENIDFTNLNPDDIADLIQHMNKLVAEADGNECHFVMGQYSDREAQLMNNYQNRVLRLFKKIKENMLTNKEIDDNLIIGITPIKYYNDDIHASGDSMGWVVEYILQAYRA